MPSLTAIQIHTGSGDATWPMTWAASAKANTVATSVPIAMCSKTMRSCSAATSSASCSSGGVAVSRAASAVAVIVVLP